MSKHSIQTSLCSFKIFFILSKSFFKLSALFLHLFSLLLLFHQHHPTRCTHSISCSNTVLRHSGSKQAAAKISQHKNWDIFMPNFACLFSSILLHAVLAEHMPKQGKCKHQERHLQVNKQQPDTSLVVMSLLHQI